MTVPRPPSTDGITLGPDGAPKRQSWPKKELSARGVNLTDLRQEQAAPGQHRCARGPPQRPQDHRDRPSSSGGWRKHPRKGRSAKETVSAWPAAFASRKPPGAARLPPRPTAAARGRLRKPTASGEAAATAPSATQPQREPPWCCSGCWRHFAVASLPPSFCWFSGSGRGRSGCHGYFGGWGSNGSYFDGLGGSPGSGRGRDGSGMIAARRGITSSKSAKRRDK